jgi:hypothetical protein
VAGVSWLLADDLGGADARIACNWIATWIADRVGDLTHSGSDSYLKQQRKRLPPHKYRRLHLNEPGSPDGAAYDADKVLAAVFRAGNVFRPKKVLSISPSSDMSGGSADDAVVAISHSDTERKIAILDCLVAQTGAPPFNPRLAVKKFAGVIHEMPQ